MRHLAIGVLCLLQCGLVAAEKSDVRELDDANFEHDTQACTYHLVSPISKFDRVVSATGATTGDWLIEFYAPWCGKQCHVFDFCRDMLSDAKQTTTNRSLQKAGSRLGRGRNGAERTSERG